MGRILTLLFTGLLVGSVAAQGGGRAPGQVSEHITALKAAGRAFTPAPLLRLLPRATSQAQAWKQEVEHGTLLRMDEARTAQVLVQRPELLALTLPSEEGEVTIDLERVDITTDDFSVVAASTNAPVGYSAGVHYRGRVRGDDASVAAISVFGDEVMGLITDAQGDRVLGRVAGEGPGAHILYRTSAMRRPVVASCATADDGEAYTTDQLTIQPHAKTVKCVRLYWEVNYDIFQGKGSVANATNYVTGLFNQSATLYANDGVSVALSQVYVWDVASPYTSTSTSTLLTQFGTTRTSFNGDLANLLGYAGGGGIAWLSGLCNSQAKYKMAYSGISSSYSTVPTYSWSVEVVTHEQGHLLGSKHTHACAWNGDNTAIDGCGPAAGYSEGSCPAGPVPASSVGGTIMSYCHLTSSTIKFANGFGPQPLAVIINSINNAACLTACSTGCGTPTGLAASSITTSGATLGWTAVSGATSYTLQWKPASSSTWTTVSGLTGTSYALSGLSAGTGYNFQVLAVCASGSSAYASAVTFTTTAAATCAVPTGLNASNVITNGATLNWTAVSGAASYTVQWKLASASTWTTV
ncbi:MAG TPA: M12 family metallo-peptidase, partial [Flavobacteriales bacterium]|nr:M12 family metallo-peptidase [Flavobacteriales bacterium]